MHLRFQTLSHLWLQYHLAGKRSSSLSAILCTYGHFDIIHNFNGVWLCPSTDNVPHIHWCASFHFVFSFHDYSFFGCCLHRIWWSNTLAEFLFLFSMCYWIIFYTSASLGWYGWIFLVAFIPIYVLLYIKWFYSIMLHSRSGQAFTPAHLFWGEKSTA